MLKLLLIIFLPFSTGFITSAAVVQTEVMKSFVAGETVTLHCSISQNYENYYYWFKQSLGEAPTCILSVYGSSMITFLGDFKNDKRFSVKRTGEYFALIINDTRSSDTGIYYCGARDYDQITFSNGMFLNYKGESPIQHYIQQFLPEMDLATSNKYEFNPGDSVNLQCTIRTKRCVGNHNVYWFRHEAGDSHPGVIYTHGNRNDECMRSSGVNSHTQSCIYNLPKVKLTSSDAGMYYCAVAMCGEILFGNGSRLAIGAQNSLWSDLKVSALVASNILCLLIIAVLLYKRTSKTKETLETSQQLHKMSSVVPADEGATEELSYAAVNFPERRKTERSTDTNVVYSTARLVK